MALSTYKVRGELSRNGPWNVAYLLAEDVVHADSIAIILAPDV